MRRRPRAGWSSVEWALLFVLAAIVATTAWVTLGKPAHGAELPKSDLVELSAAESLGPDASIVFTGAIGLRVCTFPERWPLVGGHQGFASALQVGKYTALGGDIALQRATEDTSGLRLGACWWRADRDNEWSIYARWKAWGW